MKRDKFVTVIAVITTLGALFVGALLSGERPETAHLPHARVADAGPRYQVAGSSYEGFAEAVSRQAWTELAFFIELERQATAATSTTVTIDDTDRSHPVGNAWDCIAQLEVGGDWSMQGSKYSGIGFLNAAWEEWGGLEFAPNAGMATPEQQITIARKIVDAAGPGAWSTADECGLTTDS